MNRITIPESYDVIDTETTGLPDEDSRGNRDFSKVHVIEIGSIRVAHRDGGDVVPVDDWSVLVQPWRGRDQGLAYRLPPVIVDLTGITTVDLLSDGVQREQAAEQLTERLGLGTERQLCLVGQNIIAFDLPIILDFLGGWRPYDRHWHVFDTKLLWLAWLRGMRRGRWESLDHFYGRVSAERIKARSNLEFLLRTLCGPEGMEQAGFDQGKAHRAVADCMATHLVFEAMRELGILDEVLNHD